MRIPLATTEIAPVGPLPAGVRPPTTDEERALYDAAKEFEAVFVRQMISGMLGSARGEGKADGPEAAYQDMADETMTSSLVESGSFGLAGTVYGYLRGAGARA